MKSQIAYIALVRLFLSAALCKDREASTQSAPSPQRGGGAGVREDVMARERVLEMSALGK